MGMFDKFLDAMKLDDEDDDIYDDEDYEDEEEDEKRSLFKRSSNDDSKKETKSSAKSIGTNKITPLRSVKKSGGSSNMEVCVVKPTSYEDVKDICEALLDDRTVILNMEGLDLSLAQRIIDFSSGATYAINGGFQKISNYIFILTPASVDISGDLQELMSAFDFSGIQTGF